MSQGRTERVRRQVRVHGRRSGRSSQRRVPELNDTALGVYDALAAGPQSAAESQKSLELAAPLSARSSATCAAEAW
jgi:hypothetical protein